MISSKKISPHDLHKYVLLGIFLKKYQAQDCVLLIKKTYAKKGEVYQLPGVSCKATNKNLGYELTKAFYKKTGELVEPAETDPLIAQAKIITGSQKKPITKIVKVFRMIPIRYTKFDISQKLKRDEKVETVWLPIDELLKILEAKKDPRFSVLIYKSLKVFLEEHDSSPTKILGDLTDRPAESGSGKILPFSVKKLKIW